MPADAPVVIVGAGLAGLACAVRLHDAGVPVEVFEAGDGVGGRVRTDHVDGFLLDRGFQVTLTAYPEMHRQFDLAALDLRAFEPGALVWRNGRGWVVCDPFRKPPERSAAGFVADVASTVLSPIGGPLDKLRIAALRHRVRGRHPSRLLHGPDATTSDALAAQGFSPRIVDRFFRPLVGGIQLDPTLSDSRRMFDVIFRMLADGDSAVPAAGMQRIPEQLAARLPQGSVHLSTPVANVSAHAVDPVEGAQVAARAVVVATDGPAAAQLVPAVGPVGSKAAGAVYFAADEPPISRKLVVLDGAGSGPVANVAVMSNVAPGYAPAGRHLIVAALPGVAEGDLALAARTQLRGWWGPQVDRWEEITTYRIPHGQPTQRPPFASMRPVMVDDVFVCGDHRDTGSIQGALYSGRRTAAALLATFGHENFTS